MLIVLDTNVLISATFWTGTSFRVLQLIEQGKATLVLSKEILDEYDRIVHSDEILQKQSFQRERADAVLKILQLAVLVEPKERIAAVKDDPDDNKFIEAAIAANATYIVSQDNTDSLSDIISSPNLRSEEQSMKARQDSQRVCGITNSSIILALYP